LRITLTLIETKLTMRTRDDFHKLIDGIEDEQVLKAYYALIQRLNYNQTGELWNKLSGEEKAELLLSYEESFDAENLIAHNQVQEQHAKWLKK
jgi:hypothetical protein